MDEHRPPTPREIIAKDLTGDENAKIKDMLRELEKRHAFLLKRDPLMEKSENPEIEGLFLDIDEEIGGMESIVGEIRREYLNFDVLQEHVKYTLNSLKRAKEDYREIWKTVVRKASVIDKDKFDILIKRVDVLIEDLNEVSFKK